MTGGERPDDPIQQAVSKLRGNPVFEELREALLVNYVFMTCFDKDSHNMAFREGLREMAAMVCGVNEDISEWLEKTKTENG